MIAKRKGVPVTPWAKRAAQRVEQWTMLDDDYAAGEFRLQLHGWSVERRFVVIREQCARAATA